MRHLTRYYDTTKYNFLEHILDCYGVKDLTKLHELDLELCNSELLNQSNEAETFFHKKFYEKLSSGWTEIETAFEKFIQNEISYIFDEDFLYQAFPTYRVQVPNQVAGSNWHYDSDKEHNHPLWEINFQIAITDMFSSNATWVESIPGLGDFYPMHLKYGQYVIFDGNRCRHGNMKNDTGKTRVSLDFRVLPWSRFDPDNIKYSYYGKPFAAGGYYKLFSREKKSV